MTEESRQPRPRGLVEAGVAVLLARHGPLSRRSLALNMPGKHHNAADIDDAVDRMRSVALIEELPGGLLRLNSAEADRLVAVAGQEEQRAWRSRAAVEQPPVFR
jgi:hypothetical protein